MNTLQLQLNKKIASLSEEVPYEYALLRYMLFIACALVVVYLYLVSASVLNVIAQKEAGGRSAKLESHLGVLEGEYFSLNERVTQSHAAELGLKPLNGSSFVYRHTSMGAAATVQNAI